MAVDERHLAENIRRLAGASDVSLGWLAAWVGLSRAGMMKLVDRHEEKRSYPKMENLTKLARAFDVTPNDLLSEPPLALRAAVEAWIEHGPPPVVLDLEQAENVEPITKGRKKAKAGGRK
jgi:DNA-binding Xre family transcriptional regulator